MADDVDSEGDDGRVELPLDKLTWQQRAALESIAKYWGTTPEKVASVLIAEQLNDPRYDALWKQIATRDLKDPGKRSL